MPEKRTESADLSKLRIDRSAGAQESQRSGLRSKAIILAAGAFVLILVVVYMLSTTQSATWTLELTTVSAIDPSQAESILTASGYVVAQRQAAIASKGTGRLEFLGVEEGDQVKFGEIIARLEHDDVDAAYDQAKADLEMAKATVRQREADLREAKLNYQRKHNLLAKGLISKSEFDIAEARFKSAEAGVAVANAQTEISRAALASARVNVENTQIRAPFDGTVLTKNADIGEMVAPFAASSNSRGAVVTIADMSSLEVEADVSESNIQRVRAGQSCQIILDAFPEIRYPGYVHKIVPTADRAKATVLTKIRFQQIDDKVLPEMSAKVNFFSEALEANGDSRRSLTAVAKSAIVKRDKGEVVFVVDGETVRQVTVSIGRILGRQVEVLSGVSPGDEVVLNPGDDLRSGDKIRTSEK